MTRRSERVRFAGGSGFHLAAVLERPSGEILARAVFAPCFTCSKNAKAIVGISRGLAERGIAVLRYDVTGIGESGGRFARTTFASQVDDLVAAAAWLEGAAGPVDLVVGMSLGGAVGLVAAPRLPTLRAVATLNAPATTQRLRDLLLTLAPEIITDGEADVSLLGVTTRVGRPLVEDLARVAVERAAATLGRPLLILQSTHDEVVEASHGDRLLAAARPPRSLVAVPGGDHLLIARRGLTDFVAAVLATWCLETLRLE